MITFYMTLTLVLLSRPDAGKEVVTFKDYDTVQEACAAAKKFGEDLIARVDEISGADCCEASYIGTPWVEACKKEPDRYVCDPQPHRIVETLKCKVTPAAVVYTAEKIK